MERAGRMEGMEGRLRIIAVSALAALFAPLVFVGIIVLRKAERRLNFHARAWNKRLQHEIARWS